MSFVTRKSGCILFSQISVPLLYLLQKKSSPFPLSPTNTFKVVLVFDTALRRTYCVSLNICGANHLLLGRKKNMMKSLSLSCIIRDGKGFFLFTCISFNIVYPLAFLYPLFKVGFGIVGGRHTHHPLLLLLFRVTFPLMEKNPNNVCTQVHTLYFSCSYSFIFIYCVWRAHFFAIHHMYFLYWTRLDVIIWSSCFVGTLTLFITFICNTWIANTCIVNTWIVIIGL